MLIKDPVTERMTTHSHLAIVSSGKMVYFQVF